MIGALKKVMKGRSVGMEVKEGKKQHYPTYSSIDIKEMDMESS